MAAITESAREGAFRAVGSTADKAPVLPVDWDPFAATLV
jgi:hypothetical protein